MRKIIQFFKDVWAEMKRVTWPSWEDVQGSTQVVIVSVAIFALVLGAVDLLLLFLLDVIF
ncbi:preprotein translocase subunit SecE [Spirochaeta thermophila]|uniref:Protein translocase subunit SecE n=2 Tax=Winmispira thermophila TaxID=154 RepID=G0GF87_WINT7|nr:preprotein translocase subunit SecE [Spirochaeta thermophila]ADN01453.1 hypothetical protein STHERM_c04840 [Spirochaeta thermophila DSM 6192]AEJ60786.1 preprotein translocase, SecE subunit [Spirochaeta thermophila DSM 6578]